MPVHDVNPRVHRCLDFFLRTQNQNGKSVPAFRLMELIYRLFCVIRFSSYNAVPFLGTDSFVISTPSSLSS